LQPAAPTGLWHATPCAEQPRCKPASAQRSMACTCYQAACDHAGRHHARCTSANQATSMPAASNAPPQPRPLHASLILACATNRLYMPINLPQAHPPSAVASQFPCSDRVPHANVVSILTIRRPAVAVAAPCAHLVIACLRPMSAAAASYTPMMARCRRHMPCLKGPSSQIRIPHAIPNPDKPNELVIAGRGQVPATCGNAAGGPVPGQSAACQTA
jgi:hypothetical protein